MYRIFNSAKKLEREIFCRISKTLKMKKKIVEMNNIFAKYETDVRNLFRLKIIYY